MGYTVFPCLLPSSLHPVSTLSSPFDSYMLAPNSSVLPMVLLFIFMISRLIFTTPARLSHSLSNTWVIGLFWEAFLN